MRPLRASWVREFEPATEEPVLCEAPPAVDRSRVRKPEPPRHGRARRPLTPEQNAARNERRKARYHAANPNAAARAEKLRVRREREAGELMPATNVDDEVLGLAAKRQEIRAIDVVVLLAVQLSHAYSRLSALAKSGRLHRVSVGVYELPRRGQE